MPTTTAAPVTQTQISQQSGAFNAFNNAQAGRVGVLGVQQAQPVDSTNPFLRNFKFNPSRFLQGQ